RLRPTFMESSRIVVPIKNIGSGPALNIAVSITPRNPAGEFTEASGDARHTTTLLGLGVAELTAVAVYIPNLGALPGFDLWVTYSDVAVKPWTTAARYVDQDGGRYTGM